MRITLLFTLPLMLLLACSNPLEDKDKCPCSVKIRELQNDGSYKRSSIRLQTLEDARTVSSSKIKITLNPKFFSDGSVDEITPEAQYFVDSDNNLIPKTVVTDELFSIYKIMEDLYFFDKSIGADKFLTYPRVISLQQKSRRATEIDNAFYASQFDRIVVQSYKGKKAPLGHNPGVIAHEHFHAIFNKIVRPIESTVGEAALSGANKSKVTEIGLVHTGPLVISALKVNDKAGYNYLTLRALDEGLADFWANLHTDIPNSYLASYSSEDSMNTRTVEAIIYRLDSQSELESSYNFSKYQKELADDERPVRAAIYYNATKYSNALKSISEKLFASEEMDANQRRVAIGIWMIESLEELSQKIKVMGKAETLTQDVILQSFIPESLRVDVLKEVCLDLNLFLENHNKVKSCSRF